MFAQAIVVIVGLFLLLLGVLALCLPSFVRRFLLGFATTPALHYAELGLRLLIGTAFVMHGPAMLLPDLFRGFGWLLLVTTVGLALLPWRLHRHFAATTVPMALRWLPLIGVVSAGFGALIMVATWSVR